MHLRDVHVCLLASVWLFAAPPEEAARLVTSAQALLQRQQWTEAAAQFQRAVKLDPQNSVAHFGLALALRGAGDTAKAITEAQVAVQLRPDFEEARLALGLMLQNRGDVAAAVSQYKLVLQRNPRSAEAHNWLGVALMQKNQLPEAVAEFRAALKLKPDFIRAYNNLGSTLAQAGNLDEGIDAFRAGLQQAPRDLQLRLNLGTALRTKGDSAGAIQEFQTVLKQDPENPEIHHQLGLALRESGDLEGGIRELEAALALNPESRDAYYALAQTLQRLAARAPKTAPRPLSAPAQDAMKRGWDALAQSDSSAAVQWFRQAAAADPESPDAHNALGLALGRAGNLPGAIEEFNRALALHKDFADAWYNLGAALWYLGDKPKSTAALDEALRCNPAAAAAYSLRGLAYREAGDYASAVRMFQRALALNPSSPISYFDLAELFLRANSLPAALGQFEAGLNLPAAAGPPPDLSAAIAGLRSAIGQKEDAAAYITLGRVLGYSGADPREVIAAFEAASRLKPDSAEAHNYLGLVYLQTGDDPRAAVAFRQAISIQPDNAEAHANLGALLTATDVAESVKELEKAVQLQPGLLKAHYNLAIAYGSSPKHGVDREIAQLRKLLGLDANYPRAAFSLGKALLRKGNVAEAVTNLELAAKMEPGFGEAHYQLGLALSRAGRAQEAAAELRQGRELIAASQREQTILLDMSEAKAALEKAEFAQAQAMFRRVLKEQPSLAEAHYQLGLALAGSGESETAAAAFAKALELNPSHAGARQALDRQRAASRPGGDDPADLARLEAYFRNQQFKEVQPLLESYVKEHPKSSWGWYALGYSLFAQQKLGESINALAKSLSLDVTNAEAHKVLGRNLMMIGRFDAAQREFELGEKYNPRSADLPFNLGRLFSIQDQWVSARAAFERALKIDPGYLEAIDGLGFAREALGDDDAAIELYLQAARLNEERKGNFATPYINLSAYYNRTGKTDAALEYARKAVAINERADRGWFQMARACERRGELDAAVDALSRAISINPRVSAYYYVLSTAYRRLGKTDESRQAMEMFSKLDRESNELEKKRRESLRPDGAGHE